MGKVRPKNCKIVRSTLLPLTAEVRVPGVLPGGERGGETGCFRGADAKAGCAGLAGARFVRGKDGEDGGGNLEVVRGRRREAGCALTEHRARVATKTLARPRDARRTGRGRRVGPTVLFIH